MSRSNRGVPRCITDAHGVYVKNGPDGKLVCAFCEQPLGSLWTTPAGGSVDIKVDHDVTADDVRAAVAAAAPRAAAFANPRGSAPAGEPCPKCGGAGWSEFGKYLRVRCPTCRGTGKKQGDTTGTAK